MQILNFRYANVDFFKTPHIQIRFLGKDPVFKYEFLVLFIYPWSNKYSQPIWRRSSLGGGKIILGDNNVWRAGDWGIKACRGGVESGEAHNPLGKAVEGQLLVVDGPSPRVPQSGVPPGGPLETKSNRDLAEDEQPEPEKSAFTQFGLCVCKVCNGVFIIVVINFQVINIKQV